MSAPMGMVVAGTRPIASTVPGGPAIAIRPDPGPKKKNARVRQNLAPSRK
jgi:hypothetical protein